MLNTISLIITFQIGKTAAFLLNALMLVAVVGSILLIATLINKSITKKEQVTKEKSKEL